MYACVKSIGDRGRKRKKHATHQCLGGALVLQARNIQLQSQ